MPNVLYVDANGSIHEIYIKNGGYCSAWRVQNNSANRCLLIRKHAKSPKERRHEWDDRIAEKKLELAVTSQEQALARRTKT